MRREHHWLAVGLALALPVVTGCKDDHYKELAKSPPSAPAKPAAPVAPPPEPSFAAPAASEEKPPETVICQHVLVAWRGVKRAKLGITRSKEEAKTRAEEVAKRA